MKKFSSILILLATITVLVRAQKKTTDTSFSEPDIKNIYTASSLGSGCNLGIAIDKNTQWIEYHNLVANQPYNNYVFLKGTKKITVLGVIPKDSLNYFRYNIIENDSKLLATDVTPVIKDNPPKLIGEHNNLLQINFGTFNIENKKLIIETYKITERSHVKTTTIYNKEIVPAKILIVSRGVTGKNGYAIVMEMENKHDGFKFKLHDSLDVTALNIVIKPSDVAFIYHIYLKNLSTGHSAFVSNNWLYDNYSSGDQFSPLPNIAVSSTFFDEPGDYALQIIPELPGGFNIKSFPGKTTTFHFTVLPSPGVYKKETVISSAIITLAVIACVVFVIFYIIRTRNKTKLAEQKQQKDIAQLQLDAVRSQLNPHFLFNALSGIQNLINKAEIDKANRYLAKFARLTRNVLNNSGLVDLSEEKSLLDDYLQMEQMRFGFDYEILSGPDPDILNIQIPSMLLQPFVENAVKHGLTNTLQTTKITITIAKNNADIELSIADNGKGFDTAKQSEGLGMQLSKKRIALLNTIYKDSPIRLDVRSSSNGTVVRIILTHWL